MKIKCEHCNSLINIDIEDKCSNCGAPYTDNKEYLEYISSKKEEDAKQKELKDTIINNTLESFKIAKVVRIIVFVIIAFILGLVIYNIINFHNNKITNGNDFDDAKDTYKINEYNASIELLSGNRNGFIVGSVLDRVIVNINKYLDHKIIVTYKDKTYSTVHEILELKKAFDDFKYYNVLLNYDENGYINNVTILDN